MYFLEVKSYGEIAYVMRLPLDTVKSWCRRYRIKNEMPTRERSGLRKEPVNRDKLHERKHIERFSDKYPIIQMCEFYNVSRQGYYDYINLKQAGNPDQELIDMIEECQKANKKRLGYRRVQKWLKQEKGLVVNHKKVYRITSRNNLQSVIRRRKTLKYKPNGNLKYENVLNRRTHSDTPNTVWVTDISYIIMPDGTKWLLLITV